MRHGEERNRQQVSTDLSSTPFVHAPTGQVLGERKLTLSRDVHERWCEGCQQWIGCDGPMGRLAFEFTHRARGGCA